ncbi:MAG: family 2 glycosyl transferase [Candidatus Levybacteria bacterium GW2011_GWA1_37_16]|nr:MAG: family 2 glycosyl transferase [Candidatus Levybacteria bacterium GW2011_GWA1_37_16]
MKNTKINVSIIIVNYKVEKELISCINSILKSKPKTTHEIIVVDNDKEDKLKTSLKKIFPQVIYIKSKNNLGYGGGNNLGARYAQGKYLFFLNPDTKVLDGALDNLYNFFINNHNVGIISPLFLDNNLKPFKSQGSKELTPKNIIFCQSFLRKIFSNKNIYNENALIDWDLKSSRKVSSVPGAAMMVSSNLFRRMEGFDENFFLYFEENDISKRISGLGYKLFIVPSAKIIHLVGRSTKNLNNIENVYSKSRYLYLKKHYGLLKAIFTQMILSINRTFISLFLILALAFFLRIINIEKTMPFIGDQGWFYLSARDMLINGQIPLVGIASSHPWLHQGPLWTYLLAGVFWLFGFNPLNGAYLTIILGILSVLMVCVVGSEMFSKRIGLFSALLYATSPLVVIHSRTPYHTSPISLFTLLFILSLYRWIKGNNIYFPLSILFLAILYNLELATSTLWIVLFIILLYGVWKKKEWVHKLFNKKILIYSAIAFLIPMLPILIYDFNHDFPQTLGFILWIGYRILKFFGFPSIHGEIDSANMNSMVAFSFRYYQNLIFAENNIITFIILILSFGTLFIHAYNFLRKKAHEVGISLLILWILISLAGYFVNKTFSEAYLPIFFPALIFLAAFSFDKIMKIKAFFISVVLLITLIVTMNIHFIVLSEYSERGFSFYNRLAIIKEIVRSANGREYNIVGIGDGSQFETFTMNYQYLAWWLGNSSSKIPQKLKYIIQENKSGIFLIKNE